MLTPEDRRELERCLKLYERHILTDDETAARLNRLGRRTKLDAILAEIPPALVGPLMNCAQAIPPVQSYSPASLPPITSVDVIVLNPDAHVSRVSDFISVAAVRRVSLTGEAAHLIASLWRQLPPDEQYRCHIPPYGLRFHTGSGLVCAASICWRCNNVFGEAGGEEMAYQFNAEAPVSRQLLAAVQRAAGDQPTA